MTVPETTTIGPTSDQSSAPISVQTARMINATATTDLIAEMNHETASSTPSVYFASGRTPQANAPHKTLRAINVARKDTLSDPRTARETATAGTIEGTVPENISPTEDPTRLLETQITGANRQDLDALSIM